MRCVSTSLNPIPLSATSTRTSSQDGDDVRVEVADNGIGLSEVDTQRMYSLSYTTKPNGTGVGLSVSRAIVDAHGGRIWAVPNPEGGASFYFALPRVMPARKRIACTKCE